jgi:cob(I)alamin adenosyltransferase
LKKSSIYTKSGDRGETALIGGRRVAKTHPRIEAYGLVDELMAHTSMLRDLLDEEQLREDLLIILDAQMVTASMLAADFEVMPAGLPKVGMGQVDFLEKRIDEMDASLEPLVSFVIPGGHPAISQAHIARTVCRRTEISILKLQENHQVEIAIIQFYNRLSDYFFVISRKIASILEIKQMPWKSKL